MYFGKYGLRKTWSDNYLKNPVSEDTSTINMVNVPEPCCNLSNSTFVRFGKSLF